MSEVPPGIKVKKRRGGQHIHIGATSPGHVSTGTLYTVAHDAHFEGIKHKAGDIYVGNSYANLLNAEERGGRILYEGRTMTPSDYIKLGFDPSHVSNMLSHENLHISLHRVKEPEASAAIDRYRVFGHGEEVSPSGLIHFEILRERALRDLERRGKRLPKRLGR